MNRVAVDIRTQDGVCPASEFRPQQGAGPWPGVVFYMDGLAIRPVLFDMAQRLADAGYVVLLPDLFYRIGPYEPLDVVKIFQDEAYRKECFGKYFSSTSFSLAGSDTRFFIDHLAAARDVKPGRFGCHGYCLGGGIALTAAATYPERFAAAASFHGGRLATDAPDSPHRLAGAIQARLYIAGAEQDESFTAEQEATLKAALDAAHVPYRMETYPARHGWTMIDAPVYNAEAAERHWMELIALYRDTLN